MSEPPVAGWYPDPSGRHAWRYHTGSTWTADVANDALVPFRDAGLIPFQSPDQSARASSGPSPQGPNPSTAPGRTKEGLVGKIALGVLGGLIVIGAIGSAIGTIFEDEETDESSLEATVTTSTLSEAAARFIEGLTATTVAPVAATAPPATAPPEAPEQDDDSELACRQFRTVAAQADIYTQEELRNEIQEMDEKSIIATYDVQVAIREMLISITQNDIALFEVAVQDADAACDAAGW